MELSSLAISAMGLMLSLSFTGCGGGGGGDSRSGNVDWASDPIVNLPSQAIPANTQPPVAAAANVLPISVGVGNKFLVTLKVCVPGGGLCQMVDKIMLDTGSVGLRIHASALPVLREHFPKQNQMGEILAECALFGNFYTWGSITRADVRFSEREASSLPLQVYEDSALPKVDTTGCGKQIGSLRNPDPSIVKFNGVLGIRGTRLDRQLYLRCQPNSNTCFTAALADDKLLPNPLLTLPEDNNGYQIVMPLIPESGATRVTGALVLGLNTQTNNRFTEVSGETPKMLALDAQQRFALHIAGASYGALIDSGTSVNVLPSLNFPSCRENFQLGYCPGSAVQQAIRLASASQPSVVFDASLPIGNALDLQVTNFPALINIASATPATVNAFGIQALLGAPFFYGRRISFSIDGQPVLVSGGTSLNSRFVAFQ